MKNSVQVENYWIQKYNNGIYCLLFNTKDRWVYYHRYSDTIFQIGGNRNCSIKGKYIQEIPEGLLPQSKHLCTVIQEKDQISFYFIPFELIWEGKTIYNSRK